MSKKANSGSRGIDDSQTTHKGESQQSKQQGAPSVSKKSKGKHTKDESGRGTKKYYQKAG
jgi:hypothetical protein